MGKRFRSFLAGTLCLAIVIGTGVSGPAQAGGGYADARAGLHSAVDDYAQTVVEGGVLGAFAGAASGALVGLMTGDARNVGRGAIIGATLGGIGGLMDGVSVADRKRQYARAEDGFDEAIHKAHLRNSKLSRVVSTTDRLVAVRRFELSRLQGDTSSAQRAELQRAVADDIREVDTAMAKARTARDEARSLLDQYRDAARAEGLRKEVSANDTAIKRLASDRDALEAVRNGL